MADHEPQLSIGQEPQAGIEAGNGSEILVTTTDGLLAITIGSGKDKLIEPVQPYERISSIDVIRGFALLGILVLNILSFGLPEAMLFNPLPAGGFTGLNFGEWVLSTLLFDHKMMTIFSMLFGAGLLLFADRAVARGRSPARLFYRRVTVLLVFGLLHAYLLWEGDILYTYALCGMILYLFRKWPPVALFTLGLLVLLPQVLLGPLSASHFAQIRKASAQVEAARAAGKTASEKQRGRAEEWAAMRSTFHPTPEDLAREIKLKSQGSYWDILRARAPEVLWLQVFIFPLYVMWDALGRMLIGMGLMKLGVFSGDRSNRFYITMMLAGYGVGLPLVAVGAYEALQHEFDVVYLFREGLRYNEFGSLLVASATWGH